MCKNWLVMTDLRQIDLQQTKFDHMLSYARVVSLDVRECVGDPTSTRDEDILLYISGCKP